MKMSKTRKKQTPTFHDFLITGLSKTDLKGLDCEVDADQEVAEESIKDDDGKKFKVAASKKADTDD